jgi:DNA polymerase III subunit epsilon
MNGSFLAFDVETATNSSTSICQIGYVVVDAGKIIKEKCILIQPPGNQYDARHSCIHGVDALQTKNEPTFPKIWEQIRNEISNSLLIMHNASFDINVLKSTLEYYGIPIPNFQFLCTYKMTGLSLKALAESLEIEMVRHHDPLSDARTCAIAYLKLLQDHKPNYDLITYERSDVFAGHEHLSGDILKPKNEVDNPCNPFYKKKVVFTGVLQTMSRDQAAKLVQELGADIDISVNKRTDFVIVGQGAGPSKLKKTDDLIASGSSIRILNETEFISNLNMK